MFNSDYFCLISVMYKVGGASFDGVFSFFSLLICYFGNSTVKFISRCNEMIVPL